MPGGPNVGPALRPCCQEHHVTRNVLCSLITGLALITSGVFHAYLYRKFTPVYTETQCGDITPTLDDLTVSLQSVSLSILIEVSCLNPNPYSIEILDTNPGRVFVGEERRFQVGRLTILPGSRLQERGNGTVRVRMSAHMSGPEAHALVPHFLEDTAVPVRMELQFSVGVSVSFGLGSWQTVAPFKKECGMNMAGLLVNQFIRPEQEEPSRIGPLECRDSFDFQIPPVRKPQERRGDGKLGFSAAQVAPDEVTKGEQVKNLSLGCVIVFSFFTGSCLVYVAWRTACRTLVGNDQEVEVESLDMKIMAQTPSVVGSLQRFTGLKDPAPLDATPKRSGGSENYLGLPQYSPTMLYSLSGGSPSSAIKRGISGTKSPQRFRLPVDVSPNLQREKADDPLHWHTPDEASPAPAVLSRSTSVRSYPRGEVSMNHAAVAVRDGGRRSAPSYSPMRRSSPPYTPTNCSPSPSAR